MRLVIAGIPGTGKTTIGDYLQKEKGFFHINLENNPENANFFNDPVSFICAIESQEQDIVITWGFIPNEHQTKLVLLLKERGYQLFWFDGNREAALRAFNKRGTVSEQAFQIQIANINSSQVINLIRPTIINTFGKTGKFRSRAAIVRELNT